MTPERELQIEESADRVRAQLYVYDLVPFDLKVAIARIGDLGSAPRASIVFLPKGQMKHDEAYTDCQSKKVFLPNTFLNELGPEFPRNRFTLAHELGHLVLSHSGVRSRAVLGRDFRKQANVSGVWQEEAEAHHWAGVFLMPTKIVIECKTPSELAIRCGVSLDAARIRMENLERRRRRFKGEARPIPEMTKNLITELFSLTGTTPKSFKIVQSEQMQKTVTAKSADIQGYLSIPCPKCGNCTLLPEGGCTTCKSCGDSDCN